MIVAVALAFMIPLIPQVSAKESQTVLVHELIERTKSTPASYSLVSRNEIRRDDRTIYEFAAEFNQGDLHRVETPRERVIANCRTGWSAHFDVATGRVTYSDSNMACGVYTGDGVRSAEISGTNESQYGLLQQLKIRTVGGLTRTYEIAANGAIVSENIIDAEGKPRLLMTVMSLSDHLPSADLFSEASLAKSAVPLELQREASQPAH